MWVSHSGSAMIWSSNQTGEASTSHILFASCGRVVPSLVYRCNNFSFKVANDIEIGPQFGAGSEYGREQKQEARRKKYGISKKNYSPEDQPWLLKLGSGKSGKKFKVCCGS